MRSPETKTSIFLLKQIVWKYLKSDITRAEGKLLEWKFVWKEGKLVTCKRLVSELACKKLVLRRIIVRKIFSMFLSAVISTLCDTYNFLQVNILSGYLFSGRRQLGCFYIMLIYLLVPPAKALWGINFWNIFSFSFPFFRINLFN